MSQDVSATTSRSGRRAEQRRRRRRRSIRTVGAVLVVLALVAAGFAVYLAVDGPAPPPNVPGVEVSRTQRTLLLQIQGPTGVGETNVLLAHDSRSADGAAVLIAPQVLVTVPGTGSLPIGQALTEGSAQGSRDALSDLMAVTVDDGWVLDRPTLVRLVDALGGLSVDVDVQVVRGRDVLLAPGRQPLDGARAVSYLTYLATGEQEQSRLARVQDVLDALLDRLPTEPAALAAVLGGLGPRSVSTTPPAGLAAFLIGLAADDGAGRLQYDVLPLIDVDPGGDVTVFRADTRALTTLVDRLLAASVPAGVRQGGNRVLVLNGVGTPGLGDAVRARLVPAGFVFVGSDNAPRFGYETTQVLVPTPTVEGQALGERVAKALGLPGAQIGTQDIGTGADVVVVVGADFRP